MIPLCNYISRFRENQERLKNNSHRFPIITRTVDSNFKFLVIVTLFAASCFTSCTKYKNTTDLALSGSDAKYSNSSLDSDFNLQNPSDTLTTSDLTYSIEQLDNTNGLSNSSINSIFQDSENLLWIGTWDGLNRYDGHDFKIFRPELDNGNSLSNQVILKIEEDRKGNIWVLTMHGLNRYNKKSNTFKRFYFSREDKPPFSESEFNLALDASKQVYCAVKDWGIGYFDGADFKKLDIKNLPDNTVKKMSFSPTGELLLLLDNGNLFSLKIETTKADEKIVSQVTKIASQLKDYETLSQDKMALVTATGDLITYAFNHKEEQKTTIHNVDQIISKTKAGLLLKNESGYFIIDSLGNTVHDDWTKKLENKKITSLLQGTENVTWIGTDGDGLFKMHPLKKVFNLISKEQIPEIEGSIVRAFLEVDDNSFWLGTKGNGLFRFPSKFYLHPDKQLKYQIFNEGNSSINNAVFSLCKGRDNLIFIGTDGDGISIYDIKKSKLISWSEIVGTELCSYFKSTYAIYQDENGVIWLGTNGYGMVSFKISRSGDGLKISDFKQYLAANGAAKSLSSNIIFSIIPKNNHELWIGTRLGGLSLFNKETNTFKTLKSKQNDSHSLSNNDILSLHTDSEKRLWVGTSLGLNLLYEFDANNEPKFKNYSVKDGLPNNTIHGIVSDKKGNLWVSTNLGLSNYIFKDSKFINYTKHEGLQNNEFSDGAIYQSPNSDFTFAGGVKGFNYFLSSRIQESDSIPSIFIDKISGQNQDTPYFQGLLVSPNSKTTPSIVLKHDQNFFDIELSALTYINSEKCQYAYKLNNFDQDWNNIKNRRTISFTNVPNGNYELWLKWSNSDGVWGPPVRAIDIQIKPNVWQSNLAVLAYALLFVLLLIFVWSYFNKQYKLRKTLIFQKKEEEIHQNRLNFFTNIAHEFQTPLTLILGPIHKLSKSTNVVGTDLKFVRMIERSSARLLFLTQQLLEFRKAESGHLAMLVKQFDLVNLIEQIAELFDEWALQKSIDYKLEIPSDLTGWYDKDRMEKIVFNLLSNAFKYTPENGTIILKLWIEERDFKTLIIEVTNSGKGIPKDKLNSVFDRFFLADNREGNDKFRTGIGLAYIKKLANLLRGDITVSSEENKETTFTVILPCSKTVFNEQELDTEQSPVLISEHLQNILEDVTHKSHLVPSKMASLEGLLNRKKVILIVEDEKEIHAFLNELLEEKYKILTAFNGLEALKILEKNEPDIIISDVMMPEMDGIEFCYTIKNGLKTCHIPFILLTAKSHVSHRIQGIESGANAYIPKPFHPDLLLVSIEKLLKEKELILKHFTQDTIVGNMTELHVSNDDKDLLRKVIEVIRKNIENEELKSLFIEEKLGISSSQLYRKIKQIFGFSPGDLIRTIRIKHAAELLRKSTFTVTEICYKSGFNNRSYFYREFKKMYNSTPKEYQLENGKANKVG